MDTLAANTLRLIIYKKAFPKHQRGDVKKALKGLIKAGLVIPKSTGYGQHCSLNSQRINEIEKLIM